MCIAADWDGFSNQAVVVRQRYNTLSPITRQHLWLSINYCNYSCFKRLFYTYGWVLVYRLIRSDIDCLTVILIQTLRVTQTRGIWQMQLKEITTTITRVRMITSHLCLCLTEI